MSVGVDGHDKKVIEKFLVSMCEDRCYGDAIHSFQTQQSNEALIVGS